MPQLRFYCSIWNSDEQVIEEGEHGEVNEIVIEDAYFVAGQISHYMPNDQYITERDLEGVSFTITLPDESETSLTEENISSRSSRYLNKFPGIYEAVAKYVENLDYIPAETFTCGECGNYIAEEEDIDVWKSSSG